ncbi:MULTISPECIES: DNA-protecting protein DprA [Bacillus subtilis group]|uniref:DNA-protecting protein DprA n=1 Tax=Bacillus subtilis group TaxID=653685 RepID=UPI001959A724|nr:MULTISPECIES: DNA-protecting protein DprA [Bacillus subtilis group]MCY8855544.1 DNA-protecting protein DprA [Bacillus inaquosorum]MEC3695458.1 DNA-protecting protein DprA [Bacillus subtilis]QRQ53657.1 DNA-protecting protein DprA [Bacillus subtilis]
MIKFENINELKEFISKEILLTKEAAEYLDVSTQRLHQLTQSGKISPIKSSRAGSLFLKEELYERKFEIEKTYGSNKTINNIEEVNSKEVVNDAICYFTLLALFKNKVKKCDPIYNHLETEIDLTQDIHSISDKLSEVTGFLKNDIEFEADKVKRGFDTLQKDDIIVKIGTDMYPSLLAKTDQAPMFLFMRGNPNLLKFNAISVVGTRNPTESGALRARKLAEKLGLNRIVVASGLAKGIDANAHLGALGMGNPTIAVIGTPLNKYYPKENIKIQKQIEETGLVISQFAPSMSVQRWNFPMRNAVMSGLSLATVIIEAGETSGSLIQADYALKQGRLVFIPQSAIDDDRLKWPNKYIAKRGAFKFSTINDLLSQLASNNNAIFQNYKTEPEESPVNISEVTVKYVSKDE